SPNLKAGMDTLPLRELRFPERFQSKDEEVRHMIGARLRILVIFTVSLISLGAMIAPVTAAPGQNNENATICKNGGYENWTREDGTGFRNTGDCVSYAARGGTLIMRETRTLSVTF